MLPLPPASTLFPYTTLFRSEPPGAPAEDPAPSARRPLGRRHPRQAAAWDRPAGLRGAHRFGRRSEEHTSELQSQSNLVCRLLLEKKNNEEHRDRRIDGSTFA